MASLTEHVLLNKWDDDINDAIQEVGGDTSEASGLPDYAGIIKSQLISNEAVGKGIYQDFLYTDSDSNTYTDPWDGEPTTSSNAVQASVVAQSIKALYEQMAATERFQVLLVDEFPKGEINLSAIYLVRSVCECGEAIGENRYKACYYVKEGKRVRRVEIPDFEVNLNELFYLTRAEYDAGLSDYVKTIEDLLRQKFGKYWDEDGFSLDKTLDQIVLDITTELQNRTNKILEDVNKRVDEALSTVEDRIQEVVNEVSKEFDEFREDITGRVNELDTNVSELGTNVSELSTQVSTLDTTIKDIDKRVTDNFETLEQSLTSKIDQDVADAKQELVDQFEGLTDSINAKIEEVDDKVSELETVVETELGNVKTEFSELEQELNTKFDGLVDSVDNKIKEVDDKFTNLNNEITHKFSSLQSDVQTQIDDIENSVNIFKDEVRTDIKELEDELDLYLKKDSITALDSELNELT